MVICLERGADLHIAQLMPLPLTVSCFTKIQIGVTFLVPAHLGSPEKKAVKWVCVSSLIYPKIQQRQVITRGCPGGRLQFSGGGSKMAAFSPIRARCPKK